MLRFVMPYCYSTAAVVVLAAAFSQLTAAPAGAQTTAPSTLTVFMQGVPIGSEEVSVSAGADGWHIKGHGRIGPPVNVNTARFEMVYDRDWKPQRLDVDGTVRGQAFVMRTTFANGVAASDIMQAGQQVQKSDKVAADTIVLPNMFFASYEALALRLAGTKTGTELRAYVAPQAEITLRVTGMREERIRTSVQTIAARLYSVTFVNPNGPVPAEVWTDDTGRLLRFRVNAQGLEVARDDVVAVSARIERLARPGDEDIRITSNGFSLAGTLSRPAGSNPPAKGAKNVPRLGAVILVAGSGPVDRDETVAGISVFAQLANAIADSGFLVVRYDKRGVGQSGGRDESVSLEDYAEDVRAVVTYLRKRPDVDPRRVAIVGHSEGGLVGMLAASRDKKRVAGLMLIATPGTTGARLVLEQQQHLLAGMALPDDERRSRVELQEKLHQAVISGTGWEGIPQALRRQAETPWFRSFLLFDPAVVLPKVEDPIFIVQGERDRQVPPRHSQLLLDLAKSRKAKWPAELVVVDGINHLLVPAPTGEVSEYPLLTDKNISPKVLELVTGWLTVKLAALPVGK
jgi:pimeloyl-ACP methyl ester carboxylesterase